MNSTLTHAEAIERFGIQIEADFTADDPIPVLGGLQFQGDVGIVPATILDRPVSAATRDIPVDGFPVVRGENGGNTHLLLRTPGVHFDARTDADNALLLGVLTVDEGSAAYLAHPEHGYCGIAPGTYEVTRQREQADEVRMVRD